MEIEEVIRAYLLTKTGLTDLVSTRIIPDLIKDGTALPLVVYSKVSDVKLHELTGQITLEQPVFQFSAIAVTKASAKNIAIQLKAALQDYYGTLSGTVIQHVKLLNEMSRVQQSGDGAEIMFIEDLEFEVTYERT